MQLFAPVLVAPVLLTSLLLPVLQLVATPQEEAEEEKNACLPASLLSIHLYARVLPLLLDTRASAYLRLEQSLLCVCLSLSWEDDQKT